MVKKHLENTTIPITPRGYALLEKELRKLKSEDRPAVIQAIADARAHGDLSENAEYHAAKEKQGFIEARIKDLEAKTSRAKIIDPKDFKDSTTVKFSATVTVIDEDTDKKLVYQLVGDDEANVNEGRIAISSPLARALIGKSVGDSVEVVTPNGDKGYEILKIEY